MADAHETDVVVTWSSFALRALILMSLRVCLFGELCSLQVHSIYKNCFYKNAKLAFHVFPDAQVIWMHRDPAKVIPSYSSLTSLFRRTMFGDARAREIGPYIMMRFRTAIRWGMSVDNEMGGIIHIHFDGFKRNQLFVMEHVLRELQLPMTKEFGTVLESQIVSMRKKRNDAPGNHVYNEADFGLNVRRIRFRFKEYLQKYEIPFEE